MGEEDVRRVHLVGRGGRLRVPGEERVDEDARVAVAQLEAGVAEKADVQGDPSVVSRSLMIGIIIQFPGELPPDGDAHQHPYTRLLGDEGANGAYALVGIRHRRDPEEFPLVRLAEPAALVE